MIEGNLTLQKEGFRLESGDFSIPASGVTAFFGRSGSGKSTFLRAIAGLEPQTRGILRFNGQLWQNGSKSLAAEKRDIGFVFQESALFPHLNVHENLLYASRRSPEKSRRRLDDVAWKMGISHKLDQKAQNLSGGEKQRVAIARALLSQPKLLCMDEPLSALDWESKEEILTLIEQVAADSQVPILYITHTPSELERLAANVIFIKEGHIERSTLPRFSGLRPKEEVSESFFRLPFKNEADPALALDAKHPAGKCTGTQPSSSHRSPCLSSDRQSLFRG